MTENQGLTLPSRPPKTPGFPTNPLPIVFEQFEGLNTKASRPGIKDTEMSWCDGWMPIGPNNLRTLPGLGPALYTPTPPLTVQWFGFGNIGADAYSYALLSDGSMQQIAVSGGGVTQVMAPGTISTPSSTAVGFSQWGRIYILFSAAQTNGYWVWDGTTLSQSGSGAGLNITSGISGTTIEVYTAHVWVGAALNNGALVNFSAPGSAVDFTTGNGGGSFSSRDSFLRNTFVRFLQTNGFLYLIADSSINYISGVTTSGGTPTTTFTNQNVDPQTGTPWPWSVQLFSRNIVFGNSSGIYVSYGGAVTKVSGPLDGIYNSVPSHGPITPSAAVGELFGITVYMMLLPIINSFTGQQQNSLMMWDGKKWWTSQQDRPLTFIATQELNSVLGAYGTDGTAIWPLCTTPTNAFQKVVQSKLFANPHYLYVKTANRLYGIVNDNSSGDFNLTVQVDSEKPPFSIAIPNPAPGISWTNSGGAPITWTNNSAQPIVWLGQGLGIFGPLAVAQNGRLTGMTAISTDEDLTLVSLTLLDQTWSAQV